MSETVFTLAAKLGDEAGEAERTTAEHESEQTDRATETATGTVGGSGATDGADAADPRQALEELVDEKRQAGDDERAAESALERARNLAESDEPTRAAHYYSKAIDRDPTHAVAHREYAALLARTGYREGATREYERALELDPDPDLRAEYQAFRNRHGEAGVRSDGGVENPGREGNSGGKSSDVTGNDGGVVAGIALKDDAEL